LPIEAHFFGHIFLHAQDPTLHLEIVDDGKEPHILDLDKDVDIKIASESNWSLDKIEQAIGRIDRSR
jgi:hypothetical protein